MTGLVRKATLLVVCGFLLAAVAAQAGEPKKTNSTIPAYVRVVGTIGATLATSGVTSGTVDPAGLVTITIRDQYNLPVQNSLVVLDFTNCTDVRICKDQRDASKTVVCPTISGYTDVSGQISFDVVGSGKNKGGAQAYPTPAACLHITADGFDMGYAVVPVFDQDGASIGGAPGVSTADARDILIDYGLGAYIGRSDITMDGTVNTADWRALMILYGIGASGTGCGTVPGLCP